MTKCNDCKTEISDTAETCPKCGAKTDHGKIVDTEKGIYRGGLGVFAGGLAIAVLAPVALVPACAAYAAVCFHKPLARLLNKKKAPDKQP